MKKRNKFVVITILLLSFSMLSGCWSNKEIRELALVMAAAVDAGEGEGEYNLTLQLAKTLPGSNGDKSSRETGYSNISESSKGLQMAVEALSVQTDRKIYMGHNQIIVVSKQVAENGLIDIIDFFTRDPENRYTVNIYVAENDAKQILDINGAHELLPAIYLPGILNAQLDYGESGLASMFSFVTDFLSKTNAPFLPIINPVEDGSEDPRASLSGTAVFRDDKMVTTLDFFETELLLLANNRGNDMVMQLENEEGYLTITVMSSQSNMKAVYNGDTLEKMVLSIEIDAEISESSMSFDILKESDRQKINDMITKKLKDGYSGLISHTQEFGTDVIGFGDLLYRFHYHKAEAMFTDWNETYKTLPIEVNITVDTTSSGTLGSTLVPRQPE